MWCHILVPAFWGSKKRKQPQKKCMPIADVVIARGFTSLGSQESNGIQKKFLPFAHYGIMNVFNFTKIRRKASSKALPWSNSEVVVFELYGRQEKLELHEDTRNQLYLRVSDWCSEEPAKTNVVLKKATANDDRHLRNEVEQIERLDFFWRKQCFGIFNLFFWPHLLSCYER